jgi:hypothetical protein
MTIKKVGKSFVLVSKKGKTLAKSPSRQSIVHRERQIIFFKNNKKYIKDHGHPIPIKRKKK